MAKRRRRLENGEELIPLRLHEEKLQEQAHALRQEMGDRLAAVQGRLKEQTGCDDVEAVFLRDLSVEQRGQLFSSVVKYYKQKPSADRAQLLSALTNNQAYQVAGISSRTMARARQGPKVAGAAGKRQRKTEGGLSMDEVKQIAFQACMDPRFCEIRSWISHSGSLGTRHWECIGLVDVKTMWAKLCEARGQFCSLTTFYLAMPDFYVPKKKERCVCGHCKAGRRALDDIVVVVNVLRRAQPTRKELKDTLDKIRVDLVELRGHLDKELVIDIANGHHEGQTDGCERCALLGSVRVRLGECCDEILAAEMLVTISAEQWSVVFPGRERPEESRARVRAFAALLPEWQARVEKLVNHLLLKGDRIRAVEADIEALENDAASEVWFADYSMPVKLKGTFDETEADFLSNELANNLGFMRMYWEDGQLWKEYWDFVFVGAKDIQGSIQILQRFLDLIALQRADGGQPVLERLKVWADNASDFKGGDIWSQMQKRMGNDQQENSPSHIELCYHAAGEGKTALDGHFGHLKTVRQKRERKKMERRNVEDLLVAMADVQATHVVHVELNREKEGRFYHTGRGISNMHRVVVEVDRLQAQKDSKSQLEDFLLDEVKERKTKRSREMRARQHGAVVHVAQADECQKCHHQVKKDESVEEWIQCEDCNRSWHKTCVGIAADTPLDQVQWAKCSQCGGDDPQGEMLVKQRKVSACPSCGKRLRGIDHRRCREKMAKDSAAFRTPPAKVVSQRAHRTMLRKKFLAPRAKRQSRVPRRLRKGVGRHISEAEYGELQQHF